MNVGTITAILALKDEMSGQLQKVQGQLGDFASSARTAAGVAAAAFAAMDVGAMLDRSVKATSEIADASEKMGMSAEAVQRFAFAASQAGGSLSTVATATKEMARSLGEDKAAAKLLESLNIELTSIRNLKPEEQFRVLTEAVRGIADPTQQANAAMVLFGRSGTELLPAIKAGFDEVGARAPVMRDAVVQAGDAIGDQQDFLRAKLLAVQSEAMIPFLNLFLKLPESVQVAGAGIFAFMPSLEALTLGVVAAGGPVAAFAALKVAVVAGAAALSGVAVSAFTAILPFLGPIGLIAVGVAAVYAIWKNWDWIVDIVQRVYNGVKQWLYDKLKAVFDSVISSVQGIGDKFKWLYEVVVGRSYVPDMVDGIAREFARMQEIMVSGAQAATDGVSQSFSGMSRDVGQSTAGLLLIISSAAGGVKQVLDEYNDKTRTVLNNVVGYWEGHAQATRGVFAVMRGDLSGWVDIVVGSIRQVMNAIKLAQAAFRGLQGLFGTDEEAREVNPARDAFLARFGPGGTGEGSGFHNLAALLTSLGAGEGGGALFSLLRGSETMGEFNRAVSEISDFLRSHGVEGFRGGSGGVRDFGRGQLVALHGREEVRTEAQVVSDTRMVDELRALRDELPMAIRDAVLIAMSKRAFV